MKISTSSAEFELNSLFWNNLFGYPKTDFIKTTGDNTTCITLVNPPKEKIEEYEKQNPIIPLLKEDIDKLNTWREYKDEMKTYYGSYSNIIKDVNGCYWVNMAGTGWGFLWSVGKPD